MSDDTITLTLSGSEAHALEAALTLYRSLLTSGLELGGDAREAALLMDPPALRVQTRLSDLLYGPEPAEPAWLVTEIEQVGANTAHVCGPACQLGDHYIGMVS